ncbi:MAG: hypothetical protein K6E53_16285 [Lachnospiraceae bacterium]|nr:hypothetical protein [Lachnospiraceae bacterium]
MDQILCPRCGATVHWDGYSKIVKCEYCETEYSMHPRDNVRGMQQGMPEYGDGTVVPMTIYGDTMIRDRMFMKAYVPSGWRITTGTIERFDMIGTPFVPSFRLDSPDGKTFILFRGACKYKHIEPGIMTQQLQDKLDFGPHNPISPSYYRLKTYMNAQEYCDHMATTDSGLTGVSLAGEKQADGAELDRQQKISAANRQAGFADVRPEWLRRIYNGRTVSGENMRVVIETRIVLNSRNPLGQVGESLKERAASSSGGFFGNLMGRVAGAVANSMDFRVWEVQYELVMVTPAACYEDMLKEFEKVDETTDYLPEIQAIVAEMNAFIENEKMRVAGVVNNAQMQMAADRAASWDRRRAIIQDKNNYTSNVMHQMMADNAASHNRVANLNSEMIRGVNTYYGSDGVVEASTMYDHVYQHNQNPDIYAAQVGHYFTPGVDFTELKKTNGDY